MKKLQNKLKTWVLFTLIFLFISAIGIVITVRIYHDQRTSTFRQYLALVAVGVDADTLVGLNTLIVQTSPEHQAHLRFNDKYIKLYNYLNEVQRTFHLETLWFYILSPIQEEGLHSMDYVYLSVPTIELDLTNESTFPGFIYDISMFPEIIKVLEGERFVYAPRPAWDEEYNQWVQTAVHAIYHNNELIGIVGADRPASAFMYDVVKIHLFTSAYALLITLILYLSYLLTRHMQIHDACYDTEDEE